LSFTGNGVGAQGAVRKNCLDPQEKKKAPDWGYQQNGQEAGTSRKKPVDTTEKMEQPRKPAGQGRKSESGWDLRVAFVRGELVTMLEKTRSGLDGAERAVEP